SVADVYGRADVEERRRGEEEAGEDRTVVGEGAKRRIAVAGRADGDAEMAELVRRVALDEAELRSPQPGRGEQQDGQQQAEDGGEGIGPQAGRCLPPALEGQAGRGCGRGEGGEGEAAGRRHPE